MKEQGIYTRACASRQQGRAMRQRQNAQPGPEASTAPCAMVTARRAEGRH
ncbi:hypothetical protein A2U01_0097446, partial [Trifolium medium]|nr:hypothetical protein [Trifolium medium]